MLFKISAQNNSKTIGDHNETLAKSYLSEQGLKIISSNFHCRFGEIDIIAREQNTLVFVEVKYRNNNRFGGAIAAVPKSKQQKISKSARIYLQQQQLNEYNTPCRFDVVAISGTIQHPEIMWIKNAF